MRLKVTNQVSCLVENKKILIYHLKKIIHFKVIINLIIKVKKTEKNNINNNVSYRLRK